MEGNNVDFTIYKEATDRHADENEAVGGCLTAEQLAPGGLLAFCGKFIIIIDGTLFF